MIKTCISQFSVLDKYKYQGKKQQGKACDIYKRRLMTQTK